MTTGPVAAPGDVEARLAEVLREHGRFGSRYCGCGARVVEGEHRAHVAVVLASIVADEVARAVEPVAAQLEDPRFQRPGMQLRREWAKRLREAKP